MVSKQKEQPSTTIDPLDVLPLDMTEDILGGMNKKALVTYAKKHLHRDLSYAIRKKRLLDEMRGLIKLEQVSKRGLMSVEEMSKKMEEQSPVPVVEQKIPQKLIRFEVKYNGITRSLRHKPPAQRVNLVFQRGVWVDLYTALWNMVKDNAKDLFPVYRDHYKAKAAKPGSDWMTRDVYAGIKNKVQNKNLDRYVGAVKEFLDTHETEEAMVEIKKWVRAGEAPFGRGLNESLTFLFFYEREHRHRDTLMDYVKIALAGLTNRTGVKSRFDDMSRLDRTVE